MNVSLLRLFAVVIIPTALLLHINCAEKDNPVDTDNTRPTVTIIGLAANASFLVGDTITFTATATDAEDGELDDSSLVWASSKDGVFGWGISCQVDSLSVNTHLIILRATDSEGLVGADTVTVIVYANAIPIGIITSPADSSSFTDADTITFAGSATDIEDGVLEDSSLVWTSDIDGRIGLGDTLVTDSLSVGAHTIVLTATDSYGATGVDTVTITVTETVADNNIPVVTITNPADDSVFSIGDTITFAGSATDAEDGVLDDSSLVWASHIDGQIGVGDTLVTDGLSIGYHIITLIATDSEDAFGVDSVTVVVLDHNDPVAIVTSPADGSSFSYVDTITFAGSATDTEDGQLTGNSLVWTSDLDGQLGVGVTLVTDSLSVGTHVITLTATDSDGGEGVDTITVTVRENSSPVATITSPTDSSTFYSTDTISFIGTAADPEDGTLTGRSLVWTSDIDGQIGTGDALTTDSLSVNSHVITLTATDSEGAIGVDTVTVIVRENSSPVATIIYPIDEQYRLEIDTITCVGTGLDAEDGVLSGAALVWASNLNGLLGVGDSLVVTNLLVGYHYITLTVTDSDGLVGVDTVHLNIRENIYPEAVITSPVDSATFNEGDTVTFIGSATDNQDGTLSGSSLVWSSNIDGQLGTGNTLATTGLSIGTHTISLTATDNSELTDIATITLFVDPPPGANTSVGITSPESGTLFNVGDTITFSGYATDLEDGTIPDASLAWTSDFDEGFGTGGVLVTDQLSATTHTITFTATDSDNNTTDTTITIDISPTFARVISSNTYKYGASIKPTSDGGFIIGGRGRDLGGYFDFALVKIDSAGRFVWGSNLGGANHDLAESAIETSDGGYVLTGYTKGYGAVKNDVLLIKTDQNGDLVWEKTFGGAEDDHGKSVIETNDGGYLVAGYTYSSGAGNDDMYLIKTDISGNLVWEKTFGNSSYDRGHSVLEISTGGYLITGYSIPLDGEGNYDFFLWKTDDTGGLVWESNTSIGDTVFSDGAFDAIETSDGGFMIVGNSFANAGGFDSDLKLVKTDNAGEMVWIKYFGGSSYDYGYSLVESLDGGYVITGFTESFGVEEQDVYLVKTDGAGDLLWEKTFGGFRWEIGNGVFGTHDGGFIITGYSDSYGIALGFPGMYLVRTDANGNVD